MQLLSGHVSMPTGQVATVGQRYSETAHSPPGQTNSLRLQLPVSPGAVCSPAALVSSRCSLLFWLSRLCATNYSTCLHSMLQDPSSHFA